MLNLFPASATADPGALAGAVWLDLLDPTPEEAAAVEAVLGAPLPTLGALSEIETSSRLRNRDGLLYLSTPSAAPHRHGEAVVKPVGFVLARERLVTVRFMALPAFDAVARRLGDPADGTGPPATGLAVFVELCEEIVDSVADGLEHLAEQLGALSIATFHADDTKGRNATRANRLLRIQLRQVGRIGDRLSEVRDGLLGLARIVAYVEQFGGDGAASGLPPRLASLRQDLRSLSEYQDQLANKVQFVLDALVGLIGIAQNDVFRVLTIVSIVGIPPTLMAGIYGMNFKHMPELDWPLGYPFGWAVIIVSALIPAIWFKVKGWF